MLLDTTGAYCNSTRRSASTTKRKQRCQSKMVCWPFFWHSSCHSWNPIHKLSAIDDIGVVEHAFLQGDNNELRVGEVGFDHAPNVLSVTQIQRSVNLQEQPSCFFSSRASSVHNSFFIVINKRGDVKTSADSMWSYVPGASWPDSKSAMYQVKADLWCWCCCRVQSNGAVYAQMRNTSCDTEPKMQPSDTGDKEAGSRERAHTSSRM